MLVVPFVSVELVAIGRAVGPGFLAAAEEGGERVADGSAMLFAAEGRHLESSRGVAARDEEYA